MKIILACCLFCGISLHVLSQNISTGQNYKMSKPVLDTGILGKFPSTDVAGISNNGRYYYYIVRDNIHNDQTLFVLSDGAVWKMKLDHVSGAVKFSSDSKKLIFINAGDSLGMLDVGTSNIKYIPAISAFKLSLDLHNEQLTYVSGNNPWQLTVQDLSTGKLVTFSNVVNYEFSKDGSRLLINSKGEQESEVVSLIDLIKGRKQDVWKGDKAMSFTFDNSNQQLAFIGKESEKQGFTIYYYKNGMAAARELPTEKLEAPFTISPGLLSFNAGGSSLKFFLGITKKPVAKEGKYVNVWNYNDKYLQSEQLAMEPFYPELSNPERIFACISINDGKIVRLSNADEFFIFPAHSGQYGIVKPDMPYNRIDSNLMLERRGLYMVCTDNGKRDLIQGAKSYERVSLSPDGQFVLWFDVERLVFYSYEINTKVRKDISASIPVCLYDENAAGIGRRNCAYGIAGWANDGHEVFIYDKYDIWRINLGGNNKPLNITNGYGRKRAITFGVIPIGNEELLYSAKNELLLSAYSKVDKTNGFWVAKNNKADDPECRIMASNSFYISRVGEIGILEYPYMEAPVKAKYANKYLLKRMNYDSYPNWYVTDRFVTFDQISDLNPEKKYNWLKAELVHWKLKDGSESQGILYKPENFDSTKKYPVIFHYYEKLTDKFHEYIKPELARARLNIPYFVSNGYLVFVPDIYHKSGHNGDATVNTILSAAEYLIRLPWVDSTKLGLQGHSFGGWETNHLITHTNVFKAACEASGVSNQVSAYNLLNGNGSARQNFYEQFSQGSPYGMGVTPWTSPEVYIANSPVFFVNNATTPLLIMHGVEDKAVPFSQAIEMYLALKRAGKKVWLLEYEKAGHVLYDDAKALDFTIRMKQFFDFYLKGSLPPRWMTEGVPATERGLNADLQLDDSGRMP